ncbi:MAG TPA: cellulase family glycosylhydrolase [Thermoleophilia bacterium]|nr:cellulase family glycosylhydrolase [Thermoleophilia bacterium]
MRRSMRSSGRPRSGRVHLALRRTPALVLAALALTVPFALAVAPARATVQHAVADNRFTDTGLSQSDRVALVHEAAAGLHAKVVRFDVCWTLFEPSRGEYSSARFDDLQAMVQAAQAEKIKVIVMVYAVPKWASDSSYWGSLGSAQYPGYQPFYPVAAGSLDDLGRFTTHLATLLKGEVLGYELWNEPNLWPYVYPQRTARDPEFAAHTYLRYLKVMAPAIRAADAGAQVIGGVTAPTGTNDAYRTAPQTFDAEIKALGAGAYMDAVSHHPYCVGGRSDLDPGLPPAHPSHTVELANIGTLLRLFPKKPFYLTEYGYSTADSWSFGPGVTETQQALYLRKAFRMAARHSQIRLLMTFMLQDCSPTGSYADLNGCYSGLRRLGGSRKPAWYAFAGGNRLSLYVPAGARKGVLIRLRGRLTCAGVGGIRGRRLAISYRLSGRAWRVLRSITTGAGGYYSTKVRLGASCRYRLSFPGVVSSPIRLVSAR